jgi:hypothetical protein
MTVDEAKAGAMSLSETELIYLMAYVDGQVDDDELPEVTALLARSEDARQIVAQHAAMGDWVRTSSDERAAGAGADRIAAQVMVEIEKLGGGKVIEIERERGKVALRRQRVKELSALAAFAAVAAAFFLMPGKGSPDPSAPVAIKATSTPPRASVNAPAPSPTDPPLPSVVAAVPSPSDSSATASATEPESPAVEVQSVESPSHPFSIFYVPAATGLNAHSSSVVVWIGE